MGAIGGSGVSIEEALPRDCSKPASGTIEAHGLSINTPTPHESALVDMASTTQGVLFPRMTTTQRNAIVNPAEGLLIYNTTDKLLNFYNGVEWGPVLGAL